MSPSLHDITACLGFYTRLPMPVQPHRSLATAQWAAPIAGLIVGAAAGLAGWLLLLIGVPATITAALILAASIGLTGALHEDGLADVADGFGGGHDRERKLEIMKDSRIGTYGVLALALSLLLRWSALVALLASGGAATFLALVAAHAGSRALIPAFMATVPPARPTGLSAGIGAIDARTAMIALALGGLALLLFGLAAAILCIVLLALLFIGLRRLALRQIGGQTGDVLGALQQGGKIAILVVAATLSA